jgi:hypothetical protein
MIKKLIIPIIILITIILILGAVLKLSSKPQKEPNIPISQYPNIPKQEAKPADKDVAEPKDISKDKPVVTKEFDDSFLNTNTDTAEPSAEEAAKAEIKLFVRSFLEDFSSFSSNSGYNHIEDLYDKMTSKFRSFVEGWIDGDPAREMSNSFYSIQTMVSDIEIDEFSSSKAKLILDTIRVETKAPEYYNRRFNQKAEVMVIKIGKNWKVNSVYWR